MTTAIEAPFTCQQCATELAPGMLACAGCGRLIHAERLRALAETARLAEGRQDISAALAAWREALDLLPTGSRQHQAIAQKISELGRLVSGGILPPAQPAGQKKSATSRAAAGVGAAGLLLLKFKTLLFGLAKASTLLSMLASFGIYWTLWGWKFAAGLVLSIYVHEMGHVIALRKFGFKATSPMFIPGIGALIRLKQQVVNPQEDAEIGLAGPIYGLGAALACLGLWYATKNEAFLAIAGVGAWINLFNLLPIGFLDGGRGFHAMSREQKWLAAITVGGGWYFTHDGLLMLIALVCLYRALTDKPVRQENWKAVITYAGLAVALTLLSQVRYWAHAG